MMRRLIGAAGIAFGLAISVSAGPIGQSALGLDKDVKILNHNFNDLGGGSFHALVDGFDTQVWCVDTQNHVYVPDEYLADIVMLGNWDATDKSHVRKGNNTTWPGLGSTYDGASSLQRYQAAAWLVSQYSAFPGGSGSANPNDEDLQRAIWYLVYAGTSGAPVLNATETQYARSALDNVFGNSSYGFLQWAVISGQSANGRLLNDSKQTFLVQLEPGGDVPTPEPGTYGLIGAGLFGLALLRRR